MIGPRALAPLVPRARGPCPGRALRGSRAGAGGGGRGGGRGIARGRACASVDGGRCTKREFRIRWMSWRWRGDQASSGRAPDESFRWTSGERRATRSSTRGRASEGCSAELRAACSRSAAGAAKWGGSKRSPEPSRNKRGERSVDVSMNGPSKTHTILPHAPNCSTARSAAEPSVNDRGVERTPNKPGRLEEARGEEAEDEGQAFPMGEISTLGGKSPAQGTALPRSARSRS